jgi:hypothetical protein
MNDKHPITPPPELVQQWINEEDGLTAGHIATQAARWGANQELEACIEWVSIQLNCTDQEHLVPHLRTARRPKPPSLKEQALAVLEEEPEDAKELIVFDTDQVNLIRRALEALPNE